MSDRLLAKSWPRGRGIVPTEITLVGHTRCVLAAIHALFGRDKPTRLGLAWMRFFGIEEPDSGWLRRQLRVAAAAHDWGKANDGFQGAVTDGSRQVIRHEHLSGLLLADLLEVAGVRGWLRGADIDVATLLSAVISHHVKAAPERSRSDNKHVLGTFCDPDNLKREFRLLSDHPDFDEIWGMVQAEVGSACPSSVEFIGRWKEGVIGEKSRALRSKLDAIGNQVRDDPRQKLRVAAVKSALILADAVGSAVVRFDRGEGEIAEDLIADWVKNCFKDTLTGHDIWQKITLGRIDELRRRGRWDDMGGVEFGGVGGFSRFQAEVASLGPRALLTAACGSGKTLAAWNWIKAQIDARPADRPISRILFLYPTRATATEGFRDYVAWAPEDEAGLLSGTSAYELEGMFANPLDPDDLRASRDYASNPGLYALGAWTKRVFSATADQFFPFMQYAYGPICRLPLLVESIVVVDEVHSFDRSMFNTLRRFLEEFPEVPVLCMTATLSEERRSDLGECGLKSCSNEETRADGEQPDEDLPRYKVSWIDREEAEWLARGALEDNKRVLWVSNRVDECQKVYGRFPEVDFVQDDERWRFCYHSRFKLEDRKRRHKALIGAFQDAVRDRDDPKAVFGATTQVCEMSLDLDAEILITALAPIASLIQRMGRCNRDSKWLREKNSIGRVYVLRPEPGRERPYEPKGLALGAKFIDELDRRTVSQDQLDQIYRSLDPGEAEPSKLCPFLDSGPYADGTEESFRETDDFAVQAILADDEIEVLAAIRARRPFDGFIVPAPRYLTVDRDPEGKSGLPRWLRVVDATRTQYDGLAGLTPRSNPLVGGQAR